jgi:SAM-dependent methyltransferase
MIVCPACGSESVKSVKFRVNASEAAQHFVLAESDPSRYERLVKKISALWNGNECALLKCDDCRFGFAWPFVAGDGEFYNLAYPHTDYPKDKWEYAMTAAAVLELDTAGKRILEVGSGFGYFLDKVCPRYFEQANVLAVEYNEVAIRRLKSRGYSVCHHDITSPAFDSEHGPLDYVFMFQVLEHMDSLDTLGERLRHITAPGAHLFVAVPNPVRIEFNERHDSLIDMPPNHISRWSKTAMVAFTERMGWEVSALQVEPFDWRRFVRQDLVYSHMRRSQKSGTLTNRIRSKTRTRWRRIEEAGLAMLFVPARLAVWVEAATFRESLGGSIWAHLRRR